MNTRQNRMISIGAAILGLSWASGCSVHTNANLTGFYPGYQSDVATVQIVSALVGGKNVFIPSTIVVAAGPPVSLSIFNTTDMPHGFAIAALGIEAVIPNGVETVIALPPLEGGQIFGIHCQLHPPHRHATLVVLPGM